MEFNINLFVSNKLTVWAERQGYCVDVKGSVFTNESLTPSLVNWQKNNKPLDSNRHGGVWGISIITVLPLSLSEVPQADSHSSNNIVDIRVSGCDFC